MRRPLRPVLRRAPAQVTRAITADDSGKFVPIAAFDCKGCEPIAWYPDKVRCGAQARWLLFVAATDASARARQGFTCTVRTPGAKFEDVDLGEVRLAARPRGQVHAGELSLARQLLPPPVTGRVDGV